MNATEFRLTLSELRLSTVEAAQLLGVTPRTIRRWMESNRVDGPAEQALKAWAGLNERGLAWRPDAEAVLTGDWKQLNAYHLHSIDLLATLERVRDRGGPRVPWVVNLDKCEATLGSMTVHFYKLRNGSFSPQSYKRAGEHDRIRDQPLLEDAYACIAEALAQPADGVLELQVLPGISNNRVRLLTPFFDPPVIVLVPCDAIRQVIAADGSLTDRDCRSLLVHSALNRGLIEGIALALYRAKEFSLNEAGMPVIRVERQHLMNVVGQFNSTVLMQPGARWG